MRNKIFGAIGMLWGGGILARRLFDLEYQGSGAYKSGQDGALIFGVLMLLVGAYYIFKKPKKISKKRMNINANKAIKVCFLG